MSLLSPFNFHPSTVLACSALLIALALAAPACAAAASAEPPAQTIGMLQDAFARVTDLLWEKSDEYFHDGSYERSIAVLRLVTEMDPTDVRAFAVASWLVDSQGRDAEGLALLERGLALNPRRYELYEEIGGRYDHMGNYAKAAEYLEKAVKFKDCPKFVWHSLAHAYERAGMLAESLKTWEHAAELEPDSPVVRRNLERVRKRVGDFRL